jgi:hypothetical protein
MVVCLDAHAYTYICLPTTNEGRPSPVPKAFKTVETKPLAASVRSYLFRGALNMEIKMYIYINARHIHKHTYINIYTRAQI